MNIHLTKSLAISAVFLLNACATGKFKVTEAAPPATVTVAVKQFTRSGYESKSKEDQGLADFEAIYLPTRLIGALNRTPGVSKAYFTMGDTPSTDFVVSGVVNSSDGKNLSIQTTLHRVDGAKLWTKKFNYVLGDASTTTIQKTTDAMWNQVAAAIITAKAKTKINLPEARAFAYTGNTALIPNEQIIKDAELAGGIERDRILAPLSSTLVPRANIASKYYTKWQMESVPFVTQKETAASQQAAAEFASVLGTVAMGLSAVSSISAAQSGDVYGMQLAQQNMGLAAVATESAAADAAVAENKVKELQAQLANLKRDFSIGMGRQITVTIYGKVVTLHGSQAEMLKQFRDVVKDKLNKQSTPAPNKAATPTVAATS